MSGRIDDVFHALKVIRRIVDETQEAIEAAVAHPDEDRALLDELRAGIISEGATKVTDLVSLVEKAETTIRQLHSTGHLLVSERETLGTALESIRHELELVNIVPRTKNLGEGARGSNGLEQKG